MLRLAVIGAGIMGANHARIGRQLRDASVTLVVDADPERAKVLARTCGAEASTDVADVTSGLVDAAVIACPTPLHAELATQVLAAGVPVLVEKPLAHDVDAAREIVELAEARGLTLMVGHVERFNPAVLELDNLVADLLHVDISRVSPYSPRVRDGVIADLMIHDADLALSLARSEVVGVSAVARTVRGDTEDLASALLTFANGVTASLTASRIGQNKIRQLTLTQQENFVTVDLLRQDVTVSRVDHSEYLSDEGRRYRQTGVIEVPFLEHRGEPLFIELEHFVSCVINAEQPRVSGRDGLAALELVQRITDVAVRS